MELNSQLYSKSIALTACLLIFAACAEKPPVKISESRMGTVISQTVYGNNAEQAAIEASARLAYLEKELSFHDNKSDLSKLNLNAGKNFVPLKSETLFLLKKSVYYSETTGGAFNILTGPLSKLWKVTSPGADIPSGKKIKELLPLLDYNDIIIDEKNSSAKLKRKGQMADLGGIAKGFAADEVINIYKKHEIKNAFINIGGNIGLLGKSPDGKPWRIGIQSPDGQKGKFVCAINLSDCFISTSGAYERFFKKNGKSYHHIINPKTGYPSESDIASATIIAQTSVESDAMSKVFIMNSNEAVELIKKTSGKAVIITKDFKIIATENLKDKFELTDKRYSVEFR
ncbi:MAG TPA: FAD:protein FMN transferase [Spirochaetota bacterium]|nr:FAD:protein FMN transferase [Spirochaetota bacterium]